MPEAKLKQLYHIPVLSKALDVLELLQRENQPLSVEAIWRRTSISKATVYRIVKTLTHRGYLAQTVNGHYRFAARPRKVRFGFGSQSAEMPFSEAVTRSLTTAAASNGVELLVLDNRYDAATAVKNADIFVDSKVDLVIEFQIDQAVAPVIADKIHSAGIPLIAVDIPHPHATFFGVDNYRVGFEAGVCLADHAIANWKGQVSHVLGLDLEDAGPLVQGRITGAFEGIRSRLPKIGVEKFVRIDARGMREKGYRVTLEFLRRHPKHHTTLVAAATDTSGLGALEAIKELKRDKQVAIVGQDCLPEALDAMRIEGSPYIGSVSHEVDTYGPRLIQLGLAVVRGELIPPYNYVDHRLVTAKSLKTADAVKV
ncbi:MAG: substrate-binding domain-containing protein [Terriglobales bacterium]